MNTYEKKEFNILNLKNISNNNINEHIKLYEGYVKNANYIIEKLNTLPDKDENQYVRNELRRRFSFEYNGMRNHEYYFASLEKGSVPVNTDSLFYKKIISQYETFENFINIFKNSSKTRGVGWSMLYYDKKIDSFIIHWLDEQHLGQLLGISPLLCLDMWEHAYIYDYSSSEKTKYIDAFFDNLNWSVVEENFINS